MPPDPEKWSKEQEACKPVKPIRFPKILSTDGWEERVWTQTFIAFVNQGQRASAAALNADFAVKAFAKQNWK